MKPLIAIIVLLTSISIINAESYLDSTNLNINDEFIISNNNIAIGVSGGSTYDFEISKNTLFNKAVGFKKIAYNANALGGNKLTLDWNDGNIVEIHLNGASDIEITMIPPRKLNDPSTPDVSDFSKAGSTSLATSLIMSGKIILYHKGNNTDVIFQRGLNDNVGPALNQEYDDNLFYPSGIIPSFKDTDDGDVHIINVMLEHKTENLNQNAVYQRYYLISSFYPGD